MSMTKPATTTMTMTSSSAKKTDNTVFVRYVPPSAAITRFHLEDFFGQVGPIKKCSVIFNKETSLGYGFVKFVSPEDAKEATQQSTMQIEGKTYRLTVELASKEAAKQNKEKRQHQQQQNDASASAPSNENVDTEDDQSVMIRRKRTSRVIVRNLSFYAKEMHVKKTLEAEFGPIIDIHLPKVKDGLHRGFCFVTFQHAKDAQKATQPRTSPLLIKKRPVAIDFSTPKVVHQRMKQEEQQQQKEQQKEAHDDNEEEKNEDSDSSGSETSDDSDDESSSSDSDSNDDSDESDGESESESVTDDESSTAAENAVGHKDTTKEGCTLFLRNLPFDATRHDVFDLFSRFGFITSIYLVKDKETGNNKGTAFIAFQKEASAQKALEASGKADGSPFVTLQQGQEEVDAEQHGLLYLRGRRILCDLAVDKQTAATIAKEKEASALSGKDRRNLYLKQEGRVANVADGGEWENLPESDQLKRQRAFSDKNTKLKSPLFFINPHRLSLRNLAKHVDEAQLKQLCVTAISRGLQHVTREDVVAHWKASGDVSTRDVLRRMQDDTSGNAIIPPFDETNVKHYIPSVYIDRDFATVKTKKDAAPSRGFGFVEFEHHAHALAALRELNNNPMYSKEYCAGGKAAAQQKKKKSKGKGGGKHDFVGEDGKVRVPRLIVEFTVENKAKAKKQAEHRAQQQANVEKQKLEKKQKNTEVKEKKKSRGKIQRERKRKQREEGSKKEDKDEKLAAVPDEKRLKRDNKDESNQDNFPAKNKQKAVKPPKKKHKVDKEEQDFEKMVRSYKAAFAGVSEKTNATAVEQPKSRAELVKKRWFD